MAIQLHLDPSPLRRQSLDSPITQGIEETKAYYVDFEIWGASDSLPVTTPTIVVLNADDTDVTATHCSGGGSVTNSTQVYFTLTAFAAKQKYTVKVKGTWGGSTMATFVKVTGE